MGTTGNVLCQTSSGVEVMSHNFDVHTVTHGTAHRTGRNGILENIREAFEYIANLVGNHKHAAVTFLEIGDTDTHIEDIAACAVHQGGAGGFFLATVRKVDDGNFRYFGTNDGVNVQCDLFGDFHTLSGLHFGINIQVALVILRHEVRLNITAQAARTEE